MLLFNIFVEDMNKLMYFLKIYSSTKFENTAFIEANVSPTPQGRTAVVLVLEVIGS